jgi:hypothetical protein
MIALVVVQIVAVLGLDESRQRVLEDVAAATAV